MKKIWALAPLLLILQMPFVIADCETQIDRDQVASNRADGTYIGEAVRLQTSCFSDGDCSACSANDKVTLTRKSGEITISITGPSLTYTPCKQSGSETFTLKGKSEDYVQGDFRKFSISDCNNGAFPGSGSGTLESNTINTSISCTTDEHGGKAAWNDVVLTKQ